MVENLPFHWHCPHTGEYATQISSFVCVQNSWTVQQHAFNHKYNTDDGTINKRPKSKRMMPAVVSFLLLCSMFGSYEQIFNGGWCGCLLLLCAPHNIVDSVYSIAWMVPISYEYIYETTTMVHLRHVLTEQSVHTTRRHHKKVVAANKKNREKMSVTSTETLFMLDSYAIQHESSQSEPVRPYRRLTQLTRRGAQGRTEAHSCRTFFLFAFRHDSRSSSEKHRFSAPGGRSNSTNEQRQLSIIYEWLEIFFFCVQKGELRSAVYSNMIWTYYTYLPDRQ